MQHGHVNRTLVKKTKWLPLTLRIAALYQALSEQQLWLYPPPAGYSLGEAGQQQNHPEAAAPWHDIAAHSLPGFRPVKPDRPA